MSEIAEEVVVIVLREVTVARAAPELLQEADN